MFKLSVDSHLLADPDLSAHAKLVYSLMIHYGADKAPVVLIKEELAQMIGVDRRSITRAITLLKEKGMITGKRINSRFSPCQYEVI